MAKDTDPMLSKHPDFVKVNDKDHAVLYKSPGSHRGSKGRTYEFLHVKTKEEAAAAIEDGWSETEEEAHALAVELKKARRKKSADDEDGDAEEVDPISGDSAPAKKPKKKAK